MKVSSLYLKKCLRPGNGVSLCLAAIWVFFPLTALAQEQIKIKIIAGNESIFAELEDNPSSRDFLKMLPLTLTMTDYNGTEKIASLPQHLSTLNAPDGFTPKAGDLAFYAPWGNLAIFYQNFPWSPGLIRLGSITSNLKGLTAMGNKFSVSIEQEE